MKNALSLKTVKLDNVPGRPGIYSLLIRITKRIRIQSRNCHKFELPPAIYIYVGSALGIKSTNLRQRISSHFRTESQKSLFWHIDFLLLETGPPTLCAFAETQQPMECSLTQTLQIEGGRPILGFGSSDCKTHCGGHLLSYLNNSEETVAKLVHAFRTLELAPIFTY
jgi:Uri superfamily endonuclease